MIQNFPSKTHLVCIGAKGFSLIELLIVMFIIGTLLSNVNLRFNQNTSLKKQLVKFKHQFHYVLDDVNFSKKIIGLSIDDQGYVFLSHQAYVSASQTQFNSSIESVNASSTWQTINTNDIKSEKWHDSQHIVFMDLIIDGQSIPLNEEKKKTQQPQIIIQPNYQYNPFLLTITTNDDAYTLDLENYIF